MKTTRRYLGRLLLLALLAGGGAPGAAADKSGVKPSVISLPSGPGSIEGLGESFEPQLNSGTSSYAVPLATLPGRAGFAPDLALTYSSGGASGIVGLGWSLSLPSLQRQTDKGMPFYVDASNTVDDDQDGTVDEFDERDTIVHSSGEELVPLADGTWRSENEQDFQRFERVGAGWQVRRRDGVLLFFGTTAASRVERPTLGGTYRWQLDRMEDTHGNVIDFVWSGAADGTPQTYLESIRYNPSDGSGMLISFSYVTRPDPIFDYRPGFALVTQKRLTRIAMTEAGNPVRAYQLAYAATSNTQPLSLLSSVRTEGRDGVSTLPPAEFTYTAFATGAGVPLPMPSAPQLTLGSDIDLLDLNGDALPDILDTGPAVHRYFLNRGPDASGVVSWSSQLFMATSNSEKLSSGNVQLADIDGDGRSNLLRLDAGQIMQVWRLNSTFSWESTGFLTSAGFNLADADTRLVDIDSDKRVDVLQTTATLTTTWLSLPNGRYSTPFVTAAGSPALRFSSPTTHLADMNGDRLQDLVRLDNLVAEYRPAMGGGRFGPLVTLANPHSGVADPSRLVPVDVNGDGLSDVVWINGGSAIVRLNLGIPNAAAPTAGALAPPFTVTGPTTTASSQFRVADVNGNGSTDILWNTPGAGTSTLAFVDFQPGEQPYQLKTITNGIGRTTTIAYGTSTAERERDRLAGAAWTRPTPSPIPLVKRIEVKDGREQVVYATVLDYHEGYFDGLEREFRGFARAERRELGDDAQGAPTLVTAYEFDLGASNEALKGKPLKVEARDDSGAVFHRETQTWTVSNLAPDLAATLPGDTRTIGFAFPAMTRRELLERGQGTPVVLLSESNYDQYGNQILNAEYGRVENLDNNGSIGNSAQDRAAWDDERVTVSTWSASFPSGKAAWILDRLVEQEIRDDTGAVFARERHYYDDESFAGTNLGEVSVGDRTMTRAWHDPSSPAGFVASARTAYDNFGNPTHLHDPLWGSAPGHFREIVYDSTYQTFPVEERIHTANPDAPDDVLVLTAGYDEGFGIVTSSTEFNGFTTTYGYDTFGRLTSIVKPYDSVAFPTVEYSYILAHDVGGGALINWVETRQRETAGGGTVDSRTFYDGLGRKVMTRAEGEDPGQIVVSDTVQFNARQKEWKKYLPYFETGTLDFVEPSFGTGHTRHEYDQVGREIRATQPEGPGESPPVFSRITYQPLKRIVEDEEQTRAGSPHAGAKMAYVHDGLMDDRGQGRLREVHEVVKLTDDGNIGPLTTWVTQYRYDVLDNFLGYTDSQNNKKHIFYDGLKRKVFMNDPDRSWMWYAYDNASNLVRTRDARGMEIAYAYDGVNRLQSEHYATPSESTGNALGYNQRWTTPGTLPSRPADVAYHYDHIAGPIETGYDPPPRSTPAILTDSILGMEPEQPGFDLTGDGSVNTLDVARSVDLATKRADGKSGAPLIPFEVVTARNPRGYLSWVRDLSGEEHTSYDERGRAEWVVKKVRTGSGEMASLRTGNDFDPMDRVVRLTYPDNTWVNYEYNSRGMLSAIPGVVPNMEYNPAGQLARIAYQIGTVTRYSFDHRLRLDRIHTLRSSDGVALQNLNYAYDGVSNIIGIDDERTDAELEIIGQDVGVGQLVARSFRDTQDLTLDSLYRVTRSASPAVWGSVSFKYDRVGNLIEKEASLAPGSTGMDLGELVYGGSSFASGNEGSWGRDGRVIGGAAGPHAFTASERFDDDGGIAALINENGSTASIRGGQIVWDHKGSVANVAFPGRPPANFVYDYSGRRVIKVVAHAINHDSIYVNEHAEIRGPALVKFVMVSSRRIAEASSTAPGTTFSLFDNVGSPQLNLGNGGIVLRATAYHVFGEQRMGAGNFGGRRNAFIQKERDDQSFLQDFGARHYEAYIGAFISPDPIQDTRMDIAQSHNPYAYALRKPVTRLDPDGRKDEGFLGKLFGGQTGSAISAVSLVSDLSLNAKQQDAVLRDSMRLREEIESLNIQITNLESDIENDKYRDFNFDTPSVDPRQKAEQTLTQLRAELVAAKGAYEYVNTEADRHTFESAGIILKAAGDSAGLGISGVSKSLGNMLTALDLFGSTTDSRQIPANRKSGFKEE